MKYLSFLPVQLILSILLALTVGNFFNQGTVSLFYALSILIKNALMFILPVVIFGYIAAALLSIEQRAPLLVIGILFLVTLSNALATLFSYGVSVTLLPNVMSQALTQPMTSEGLQKVIPLFEFTLPEIVTPDRALMGGMVFGLIFSFYRVPQVKIAMLKLRDMINWSLQRFLIPMLPFYVFGFVLKLHREGTFNFLAQGYAQIFIIFLTILIGYLCLLYFIGSGFRLNHTVKSIKNMLPAGLTALCTMSSAATMPVTISSTEKNLKDPLFTHLVIPTTVNIHLVGDALMISLMALVIPVMNGMGLPSFIDYLVFAFYFCLARFSVAAIPGGGIIVILPILQERLGFTSEMLSLITTLYILQDSFGTASNVMGNGAFAMIVERALSPFSRKIEPVQLSDSE